MKSFQTRIERIYLDRDRARGWERTFAWFVEEVGELARALHRGGENLEEEFADVAAWLVTLASIRGVDMERAIAKYAEGCPTCKATPCACVSGSSSPPSSASGRRR